MGLRKEIEAIANEDGGAFTAGARQLRRELRVILARYPETTPTNDARPAHPSTQIGRLK